MDALEPLQDFARTLFIALDKSFLADWVKGSVMIVPWAGVAHLVSIALLGGAILMVDLRVLGFGLTSQPAAAVNRTVRPLLYFALVAVFVSGSILALGEVMRLYHSPPYWLKMAALIAAILFTFGVRNRLIQSDATVGPVTIICGLISVALWISALTINTDWTARAFLFALLAILLLFALIGRRASDMSVFAKTASIVSVAMWLTVAAAGRWIAFY